MKSSQSVVFDVEMALQEDIGAELDYFTLLTLLGLDDEAQDFASTTLWSHLQHFPVLAEVANYFVGRNHTEGLKKLLDHVQEAHIQFDDPDESLFLTYIRLIGVDQDIVGREWYQTAAGLTETFDSWSSETSCLILEIKMTVVARGLDDSLFDFLVTIGDQCSRLLGRQMPEHAARMFCIACSAVPKHLMQRYKSYLQRVYRQLPSNSEQALARAQRFNNVEEADNWRVYSLLTDVSFLTILHGAISNSMFDGPDGPPKTWILETEELLQKVRGSFLNLFEDLPSTKPRGRHFLLMGEVEKKLEDISLLDSVLNLETQPAHPRNLASSFRQLSLTTRTNAPSTMQITKAVESNQIEFNIISESIFRAHAIDYEPYHASLKGYKVIGRIELICRSIEASENRRVPSVGYWYITYEELPGNAQAVVSAASMPSVSEPRSGRSSLSEESLGTWNQQNMNKRTPSANPNPVQPRYLYRSFPQ